jgi:hypothetical protein
MGGGSKCGGGDLNILKAGLLYLKVLIDGLTPLEGKPAENQEESGRKMFYGQDKWLNQDSKNQHQNIKNHNGGEVKECK